PGTCSSGAGYAGGQGVTNYYGDGITVSHNTFKEVSWHYIQGGGASLGMMVDHNLFEGPIPPAHAACTHLNVWQIWDGGRNDTFGPGRNLAAEHNIAVATQSKGSPQRLIIGACTGSCAVDYNVTDDNSAQGPHSLTGWTPRWQSTSYGNAGYYIPTPGLPNPAGYEGQAGP